MLRSHEPGRDNRASGGSGDHRNILDGAFGIADCIHFARTADRTHQVRSRRLVNGPMALFQLFVMALPGLLGWGLWNMQNSARVSCLIVLAICAASGILLVTHFGVVSFMALLYFGFLLWGGAIAVYLTRPSVKRAFQPEIEVINFKDL